jgi:hypothetical protein
MAIDGIAPHDIPTEDEIRACAVSRKYQATAFCYDKGILENFPSSEKTVNHDCYIETRSEVGILAFDRFVPQEQVPEKLLLHDNAWRHVCAHN